jgi:Nitrile hydratase, alpha chain
MDRQAFQKAWGKVVARAWADAGFKERLLAAPEVVFQEYGFEVPPNILIRVVSNNDRMIRLRCTRCDAPEWYVECTSSCYRTPEKSSQMKVWTMWQAGWTEGVTISVGTGL